MKTITLDFETYYDNDYSLRKMTPVEYILDPRFEVIGCAVKDEDFARWMEPHELGSYLRSLPNKVTVVSHNALFDMCILAWKFDYVPTIMVDTLGMARAWLGHILKSLSLSSVAAHLGIGVKGDTVHKVVGMNREAIIAAGLYGEYAQYSCNDADLCYTIYRKMIGLGFPAREIVVMDTVLRCAVQPRFELDETLLAEHLHATIAAKNDLMARCGLSSRDDLMSNDKFAAALSALGVEPPTKISPLTGKETYAFAKTDPAFIELEEHDNPEVQALVAARMGVKSTIEETRTQRLMNIARLEWPGGKRGLLPMPLRFSGAHTHRLSGEWKLNMQNLPSRGNNRIRSAIKAPEGYKVIAPDASQIEARLAAWFCGCTSMTQAFANGEDIYSSFASEVFGYEVTKETHKVERFIGKTAVLGLQYGLGWEKFQKTVALHSKAQVGKEVLLSDEDAAKVVQVYRNKYREIPAMWSRLNNLIPRMTNKDFSELVHPVQFQHEKIALPSGLYLHYHDLQNKGGQWWFTYGGKPKYLYGGKMLENIVQALARICVMDAAVAIRWRLASVDYWDAWLNLQVHDELVYIVKERDAKKLLEIAIHALSTPPKWGPDIPLKAEGSIGDSYGDCK
jgi:DNA polymerase